MNVDKAISLHPITAEHEEIFRTVVFMSKMKNKRKVIKDELSSAFNNRKNDVNTALAYAVFCLLPCETEDVLVQKESIETAIEVFDHIIKLEPGNWLARYSKARLMSLFSDSFREEREIIDELDTLISMQENSKYEPYYILPYMLYAELLVNNGEMERAKAYIEKAASMETAPITLLKDFLYHQLLSFESKLRSFEEFETANRVRQIMRKLFPAV